MVASATIMDSLTLSKYRETARANVEFIVRAVNAHDALAEALDSLLKAYSITTEYTEPDAMRIRLNAKKQARAALALARKEA